MHVARVRRAVGRANDRIVFTSHFNYLIFLKDLCCVYLTLTTPVIGEGG
jgi:hypothetical protein